MSGLTVYGDSCGVCGREEEEEENRERDRERETSAINQVLVVYRERYIMSEAIKQVLSPPEIIILEPFSPFCVLFIPTTH